MLKKTLKEWIKKIEKDVTINNTGKLFGVFLALLNAHYLTSCISELDKFRLSRDMINYIIENTDAFILKNGYHTDPRRRLMSLLVDQ